MCSITRADLDQALSDRRELAAGERISRRDRGAHAVHQPERGGVEDEPHLIGGRAVTRHAIRRQPKLCSISTQCMHSCLAGTYFEQASDWLN